MLTKVERLTKVVRYHLLKGRFSNDTTVGGGMGEWYGMEVMPHESAMFIPQLGSAADAAFWAVYMPEHGLVHVEILETEERCADHFVFNVNSGEVVEYEDLPVEVQNR